MDIKEIEKKFDDANKNTLQILEKVIVFKNHMADEINFIAKQAIESAKMEILLGQLADIPDYKLSNLAQRLKYDPSIEQMSGYKIIEAQANLDDNDATIDNGATGNGGTIIIDDTAGFEGDGVDVPVEPREKSKPHSQVRRTWLALQTIEMDDCELRIEVARLKQNGGKKPNVGKEQVTEFEL